MTAYEPVRAHVGGALTLRGLRPKTLEGIRCALRVKNPKHVRMTRKRLPTAEPPYLEAVVEMPDGSLHVPRGAIGIVRTIVSDGGQALHFERIERSRGFPIAVPRPFDERRLRDYQALALAEFFAKVQGVVVLPCGGGKTVVGVAALSRLARTTLVIVPSKDLADQWIEEIRLLGIEPGLVGDGKDQSDRDVVVGIDDTIAGVLERSPSFANRFALVIVDEAHHVPCRTMQRAIDVTPAMWRLGLTATPDREDGLEPMIEWILGPRLLERTTRELIDAGYLMRSDIEFVSTDFRFAWDGNPDDPHAVEKRTAALERALAEDLSRNVAIADRVVYEARKGETVLVLANRKEMVAELADLIGARGTGAAVTGLTSASRKKLRKASIADFKAGALPVLVATSLADEGLNVPRLSRIVLAFPQKARGGTTQRLGRLLRLYDKRPKLIDFVDPHVETLTRRAEARRRVYREAGLIP